MSSDSSAGPRGEAARVYYTSLNRNNVGTLRKLNSIILPVQYSERFYTDVLSTPAEFSKLVFYRDVVVGAVAARVEKEGGVTKLYIMTLGLLAPYRNMGIGSQVLRSVLQAAEAMGSVQEVYLHVHVDNDDAVRFYNRFGFTLDGKVEGYYRRITPPDAYVLRKRLDSGGAPGGA